MKISQMVFNLQSRHEYMKEMAQCSKSSKSKSRQTRVTIHVFCMLSHGALHLCEVS